MALEENFHEITAVTLLNLAILHSAREETGPAKEAFEKCIKYAEQVGALSVKAKALVNLAAFEAEHSNLAEAERINDSAVAILDSLSDDHNKTFLFITVGQTYQALMQAQSPSKNGLLRRSHDAYQTSIDIAEGIGSNRGLSYALGNMGHLYEAIGRIDEAFSLTQRAIFAAQQAGARESQYKGHWQSGRMERGRGNTE